MKLHFYAPVFIGEDFFSGRSDHRRRLTSFDLRFRCLALRDKSRLTCAVGDAGEIIGVWIGNFFFGGVARILLSAVGDGGDNILRVIFRCRMSLKFDAVIPQIDSLLMVLLLELFSGDQSKFQMLVY